MPASHGSCPEGLNREYNWPAKIFQATCFLDDVDEKDPDKERHRRENKYVWDKMKEAKGRLFCCLPEWRGIAQSPQEETEKRITFVPLSHPYCSNYARCRTELIGGTLSFDSFLCMHCARDGKLLTDCITNVNLNFLCKNSCGSFLHPNQDVLAVIDKDIAQNNPDTWKWLCWNTVASTPEEQIKTRRCLKINDEGANLCADCYSARLGGNDWGTFIT
ncbi:hypothetical protein BS50DRAFT_590185 [Corynespora cassiicola Philippines]|uniref:Uncharacterized protein n=1 Tax=Corynespora cassiicola Philippines TaxID=1448308 RepID=A0A2T2NG62_CORCC|nr:hypothetical protein BS50DRAFT_590185 [Corynespora cassiicola Philippines]